MPCDNIFLYSVDIDASIDALNSTFRRLHRSSSLFPPTQQRFRQIFEPLSHRLFDAKFHEVDLLANTFVYMVYIVDLPLVATLVLN